jgi:hypothetical protein
MAVFLAPSSVNAVTNTIRDMWTLVRTPLLECQPFMLGTWTSTTWCRSYRNIKLFQHYDILLVFRSRRLCDFGNSQR